MTRIVGTLRKYICTYMTVSHWILSRMRTVQKQVVEKIKTYILCSLTLSPKSCHLWDNVEKYGRALQTTYDDTIWHVCFACWMVKVSDTHSEYVILIALPRQQWYHECAWILCLYVHFLSCYCSIMTLFVYKLCDIHHLFKFKSWSLLRVIGCYLPLFPFWKVPCLWTQSPGQLNAEGLLP